MAGGKSTQPFARALRHSMQSTTSSAAAVAQALEVAEELVHEWLASRTEPLPRQVASLEALLSLEPGELSELLGYRPISPLDHQPVLMTSEEAAHYLATTTRHMRRLTLERRIPHVKLGSKVRFRRDDLDTFIKANRRP